MIDTGAAAVSNKEILIGASLDEVWQVHTNIDAWSDWNADVSDSKLEGDLAPGSVFRWKSGGMGITSRIEAIENRRMIEWSGEAFGAHARHVWTFRPENGGTLVTTAESLDGWLVRLFRGRMQRMLDTTLNAWLQDLKAEAEMGA